MKNCHILFSNKQSAYRCGLTREFYSQSLKELFMLKRSGVESKVPYLLTTAEGRPLGGELRHAFIQSIFLPLNFAKATLNILHSTARD